ncbi:hypothetical protein H5410_058965, partial [Solanum commersonii]
KVTRTRQARCNKLDPRSFTDGLGIRNLKYQYKALEIKWLWRNAQEPQTLWSSVIKSKYGEEDGWVSKTTPDEIRVHNVVRTRFWKDKWIGTRSLQELFPDLFDLAQDQHHIVGEMWTQQGWD